MNMGRKERMVNRGERRITFYYLVKGILFRRNKRRTVTEKKARGRRGGERGKAGTGTCKKGLPAGSEGEGGEP